MKESNTGVGEQPELDPEAAVRTLLAMSGLSPSEAEIAKMADGFAAARATARMLYGVEGTRYEESAQIFRARIQGA